MLTKPIISPDFTIEDIHKIKEYHFGTFLALCSYIYQKTFFKNSHLEECYFFL